jgi:hypothetical protein
MGGGKDSNTPFVILTTNDNKLTYTPDKIYHFQSGTFLFDSKTSFISVDDVPANILKDGDTICFESHDYLFFNKFRHSMQQYSLYPLRYLNSFNKGQFSFTYKTDSIDIKEYDYLVTTLTLTGLKRKNSDIRDFVGEIASYQDNLIKVDRTNPDNPTIQFLSFENSQYKDNYEREERVKLAYNPFDML